MNTARQEAGVTSPIPSHRNPGTFVPLESGNLDLPNADYMLVVLWPGA